MLRRKKKELSPEFLVSDLEGVKQLGKKTKKQKIYIATVGVLLAVALVIGSSFAYLKIESRQEGQNRIATLCLNIEFEEDVNSAINLEQAYPLTDTDGMRLTPYTFKVTNKCSGLVSYQVNMDILDDLMNDEQALKLDFIKTNIISEEKDKDGDVVGRNEHESVLLSTFKESDAITEAAYSSRVIDSGTLRQGHTMEYKLRLWIDEATTLEEGMNKYFTGKVAITGTSEYQFNNNDLQLAIYVDNEVQRDIPSRGAYTVKVDCHGNGNGSWDYNNWGVIVTGFTNGAICDVDFTSQIFFTTFLKNVSESGNATIEKFEQAPTIQTESNALEEYRYTGASPNNYVYFGCSENCTDDNLYRVIGVIPTKNEYGEYEDRVKLIKAKYYTETSSGLLKDTNATYPAAGGSGKGYMWNSSANNQWQASVLQSKVLNGVYWSSLGEYQNYISPAVWYLGAPTYSSYTTYTPDQFYNIERSNTKGYSGGVTYMTANIGLMYPSDYGYSLGSGYREESIYNNSGKYVYNAWLYNLESKYYEWTMTPESSHSNVNAWYLDPAGLVSTFTVYYSGNVWGVRPVFFLKSNVMYNGGDGSASNPYRVIIG